MIFKQIKECDEKDGEVLAILLYRTISNYLELHLKTYRLENKEYVLTVKLIMHS